MDAEYIKKIETNLGGVLSRIRGASNGRKIDLLLATKTVPTEVINLTCKRFGVSLIGENKVQELLEKYDALDKSAMSIHFIGHLQTNKVKKIVDKVDMIHSVDKLELAKEISSRSLAIGKKMPILIEVNIAKETEKSGVYPENAAELVKSVASLEGVEIKGLMTMAKAGITSEEYKAYFDQAKALFDEIAALDIEGVSMEVLSMGMSDSYAEAAECGSTMVRVGSAVFGKREYPTQNVENN